MKKLIPFFAASILFAGNAAAGVWAPQSSGGGGGSSPPCYLIYFNAGTHGNRILMGNGIVSGSSYTGFLRGTPNPSVSGSSRVTDCGAGGQCAWDYAGNPGNYYSVVVSGLPILSAQAVACF